MLALKSTVCNHIVLLLIALLHYRFTLNNSIVSYVGTYTESHGVQA